MQNVLNNFITVSSFLDMIQTATFYLKNWKAD